MKKLLFFFVICFFAACSSPNKIPGDVIGIDSMKLIIWDLTRAGKLAQIEFEKDNPDLYSEEDPISKRYMRFKTNRFFKDSIRKKDTTHLKDTLNSKKDTVDLKLAATTAFQQVFDLYHITKEKFYKSYRYYEEHPDKNDILMDSLTAYSSRQRQQLYRKVE